MEKDPGKPSAYLGLIVSIFGIILTMMSEINFQTLIFLIVLTSVAIVFTYLSFYIKKTENNEESIKEIKANFKISERLNKLEIRVFGK